MMRKLTSSYKLNKKSKMKQQPETNPCVGVNPDAIKTVTILQSAMRGLSSSSSINKAFNVIKTPLPEQLDDMKDKDPNGQRNFKIWKAKMLPSFLVASCEVVGQELIRLVSLEHKHKTRFAVYEDKLGVISELLPDYLPLTEESDPLHDLENRRKFLKGLGVSTLLALFLNETDLKLEHLDQRTAENIDGDWKLSLLHHKSFEPGSKITEEELRFLPYKSEGSANQWLDQIKGGKKMPKDKQKSLIFYGLEQDDHFRRGVNETILRLLILPDLIWQSFVEAYLRHDATQQLLVNTLRRRRDSLRDAALLNVSFTRFILTEEGEQVRKTQLQQLQSFKTTKKRALVSSECYPALKCDISERFLLLRVLARKKLDDDQKSEKNKLATQQKKSKRP